MEAAANEVPGDRFPGAWVRAVMEDRSAQIRPFRRGPKSRWRGLLVGALLCLPLGLPLCLPWCARAEDEAPREFDWGFLASRRCDVRGNQKLNILGPFLEFTTENDGDGFQAVRPLYSHTENGAAGRERFEIVWPLATAKSFENQKTVRVLTAIYTNFDRDDPDSRYRFWVVPFYYQGRDADLESYWALWPLWGSVHEFLSQDEINFALWPILMTTRMNDMEGRHVVWPILGRTTGEGVDRFRVFPFYARSSRENVFEKTTYLWPFYTRGEFHHPLAQGSGYILFPLWGHMEMNNEETWYVIPPFNRFTRSETQNKTHIVWPFFQYYTGQTEKLYLWPLWGTKVQRGSRKTFFLWPIFSFHTIDQGETVKKYTTVLPFYTGRSNLDSAPAEGEEAEVESKRKNFWPLYSYYRDQEFMQFRMLDLWPFKHDGPIERNLAPFWALYVREGAGDTRESELLWGLYRHRRRGEVERYVSVFPLFSWHREDEETANREFSILKGLLGYESDDEGRRLRLLYFLRLGLGGKGDPVDLP